MDKSAFEDRRRSLEEAFFRKENARLLESLRGRREREAAVRTLREASGILDEHLLNLLVGVGIEAPAFAALSLAPLVWVAWADRGMDWGEREALLEAATREGIEKDSPAYDLLQNWLHERPQAALFEAWTAYTKGVVLGLAKNDTDLAKQDIAGRARRVAEATGGILGLGAISESEKEVLAKIESAFAA